MSASSTTTLGNSSASPERVLPNASRSESLLAIRAGAALPSSSAAVGLLNDIQKLRDFLRARAQLAQRVFGLLAGKLHAAVPGGDILHVLHALALDRIGDDHAGAALRGAGAAEGAQDFGNVVAVDLGDRPLEGAPFRGQ